MAHKIGVHAGSVKAAPGTVAANDALWGLRAAARRVAWSSGETQGYG